ncbi:hypothetical protein [Micromonospora kangleipakensis]|uniref:hypothetical protein n=1 Tax=Micromonospora kangleipakensis TaxID=1077942 RepID=UPI001029B3C2|nr:hypothetical protein [Micromonospora kangleipakensis]
MFTLFRRRRNAAARSYRGMSYRGITPPPPAGAPGATRPNAAPAWAYAPTVAVPRPGRAGWLTPAQAWRANGGRW